MLSFLWKQTYDIQATVRCKRRVHQLRWMLTQRFSILNFARIVLACSLLTGWLEPAAAQSQQDLVNPTGACGLRTNPSLAGFYGSHHLWVPDCQSPRREYWRVFTKGGNRAWMLPRPDGAADLSEICQSPAHTLAAAIDRYKLCQPADRETVRVVNNMDLSDATQIARFLNSRLHFRVIELPTGVATKSKGYHVHPYPVPADVKEICNNFVSQAPPDFARRCFSSGDGAAYFYRTRADGEFLAANLNRMYGVQ